METEKQLADAIEQCERMIRTIHAEETEKWTKKQRVFAKRANIDAAYGEVVGYVMNEQYGAAYTDMVEGLRKAGARVRALRDYLAARRQQLFPKGR